MEKRKWNEKPYNNLDYYMKHTYGRKIYKIALDGGMSCPNRDGVLDTRGCIFCSKGGSGDFAVPFDPENPSVHDQLQEGKQRIINKAGENAGFIGYFQSYTNTYAPIPHLEKIYTEALSEEDCIGISIGTRPDCLSEDVLILFAKLKETFPDKFIWVELGLQTIHRNTAQYIRRGYELSVFEEATKKLATLSIPIIVHVILGLPGESVEDMLATVEYLNTFPIFGIKLQLLHVLEGTDLANDYADRKFDVLTMEEYIDIVIRCLERLCQDIVIHRLTGDGSQDILIAPDWSKNKKKVLNTLLHEMKERNTWQGKFYENTGYFNVI